jgi:hypothetical protein
MTEKTAQTHWRADREALGIPVTQLTKTTFTAVANA